ncbi:uncharacterized protein [Leptinotarsa decemlineata]|uniref:uncharacterized protein n=1 Tax=Leptinotarsa decemlineata TaxID=7539 RepID=UPI003D30D2B2
MSFFARGCSRRHKYILLYIFATCRRRLKLRKSDNIVYSVYSMGMSKIHENWVVVRSVTNDMCCVVLFNMENLRAMNSSARSSRILQMCLNSGTESIKLPEKNNILSEGFPACSSTIQDTQILSIPLKIHSENNSVKSCLFSSDSDDDPTYLSDSDYDCDENETMGCRTENYAFRVSKMNSPKSLCFIQNSDKQSISTQNVYQTAKIAKLLMLMERGEAGNYKGKTLDEIDLKMDDDILEEEDAENYDMKNNLEITEGINDSANTLDEDIEASQQNIRESIPTVNKNANNFKKRLLVPWTNQQKKVVTKFFQNHINMKKPPRRHECENLISKYPELLENKSWAKIKVFIQNVYKKNI